MTHQPEPVLFLPGVHVAVIALSAPYYSATQALDQSVFGPTPGPNPVISALRDLAAADPHRVKRAQDEYTQAAQSGAHLRVAKVLTRSFTVRELLEAAGDCAQSLWFDEVLDLITREVIAQHPSLQCTNTDETHDLAIDLFWQSFTETGEPWTLIRSCELTDPPENEQDWHSWKKGISAIETAFGIQFTLV